MRAVAFRGPCDVTLSLSLNLVPVRADFTPEHTHSPSGAAVRHTTLSFSHMAGKVERGKVRGKVK